MQSTQTTQTIHSAPAFAPRLAALTLAALMTLATVLGVGQLADQQTSAVQMAQAASAPAAGV